MLFGRLTQVYYNKSQFLAESHFSKSVNTKKFENKSGASFCSKGVFVIGRVGITYVGILQYFPFQKWSVLWLKRILIASKKSIGAYVIIEWSRPTLGTDRLPVFKCRL